MMLVCVRRGLIACRYTRSSFPARPRAKKNCKAAKTAEAFRPFAQPLASVVPLSPNPVSPLGLLSPNPTTPPIPLSHYSANPTIPLFPLLACRLKTFPFVLGKVS